MRKYGKINKMSAKFEDYNYVILGQGGIGKTTCAYEVGKLITGSDEGTFIITVGMENTTDHIPNAFSDRAPDYATLLDIVDDLCENKQDYPDTKFVAIDSMDELFRITEKFVINEYNASVDMEKRIRSIKQAYGGYQGGENKVVDYVIDIITKLNGAGYKMLYIGHTKTKSKTDPVTNVTYEQYTCSVDNKYYNAIKDKVNLVVTGYFEKEFENLKSATNPFTKAPMTSGELTGQKRVMTLVDDENAIDTKTHFEYIVPKITFSAEGLIKAVEDAIKKKISVANSSENGVHPNKPLLSEEEQKYIDMKEDVKAKCHGASPEIKSKVVSFMKENNINMDTATVEQLNQIVSMLG